MDGVNDADLYRRGARTLVASWQEYARGASGPDVRRLLGVVVAIFPEEPERRFYNNALIERDLTAAERSDALDALEAAYAAVGVTRFAAWVHKSDDGMRDAVEARGYMLEESTPAMAIALAGLTIPELELAPATWSESLRFLETLAGVPSGLLAGTDPSAFHVLLAGSGGENVAAGDRHRRRRRLRHQRRTVEHARRRTPDPATSTPRRPADPCSCVCAGRPRPRSRLRCAAGSVRLWPRHRRSATTATGSLWAVLLAAWSSDAARLIGRRTIGSGVLVVAGGALIASTQ